MTTGELLDKIREYYLRRFREVVAEQLDAGATVATETAYRDESGQPAGEGQFNLPARGDVFVITDGEVTESLQVDTEGMLSFQQLSFAWESALVTLAPFQWNWCEVSATGNITSESASALVKWFHRWFVAEQDGTPERLLGAIHYMSDPDIERGRFNIAVDLGSAPIEALEELLDAAVVAGATKITIASGPAAT